MVGVQSGSPGNDSLVSSRTGPAGDLLATQLELKTFSWICRDLSSR